MLPMIIPTNKIESLPENDSSCMVLDHIDQRASLSNKAIMEQKPTLMMMISQKTASINEFEGKRQNVFGTTEI